MLPFISVVTASLNSARTIEHCIDSVNGQSYPNVEIIVVDGGSTDGTVEIIKKKENKIAYWESQKDHGIYHAWNKALGHVSGEWTIFLGADDFLWSNDVLEKLVPHLSIAQYKNKVVYCQVAMVDRTDNILEILGEPWERIKNKFPQIMGMPHPAVLYHNSMFKTHGRFDESLKIAGDFEFLLRELKSADAFFIPELTLTGMHYGGVSSDPKNSLALLMEIRAAQKKHGYKRPGIYWIMSYARTRVRFLLLRFFGKKTTAFILDCGRSLAGKKPYWTRI